MSNRVFIISAILSCLIVFQGVAVAQCPIDSLGQNPSTAFPVCGTNVFVQAAVNLCGGKSIPSPKCNTNVLTDVNPYWYKFTCFESGTLGFTIQPNSSVSDYDWQVFDITGKNPDDVYVDRSLTISSNWSQYYGNTGTNNSAANLLECEGPVPQFSKMPNLIKGHEYLLLVSHFTPSQAGYRLVFGGGTASITDTTLPRLKSLEVSCDGKTIGVKLSKKMKCSTLAANGSDFRLSPALATITGALAVSCSNGFDVDSVVLTINQPLPEGKYTVYAKNGSDGNTMLDYCDKPLPLDDSVSVMVVTAQPTPMDSIQAISCKSSTLNLVFAQPILCNSIAANGSDFLVTGPSPVTVTGATGNCAGGRTKTVSVQLSGPIQVGGIYSITLQTGSDGNTLLNDCTKETVAGSSLSFSGYDTVSAVIDYAVRSSCIDDTLSMSNSGRVNINSWKWTMDDGSIATNPQVARVYDGGTRTFKLVVSNGFCTDSSALSLNFDKNRVKAIFEGPAFVCPLDTAFFIDSSTGPVVSWAWNFGNGQVSAQQQPLPQLYPTQTALRQYTASLIVASANGCRDSAFHTIQVPGNCYIAVPTAFTPNGDGLNDYLYPLNAYKAVDLDFKVYNRLGQLVWHTTDWTQKWDGRINGNLQASGSYVWHLVYFDPDKNKKIDLKGMTTLIR